jgi:ankyrin repeat protein
MTTASPWLVKAVDDNDADAIQSMFKVGVDLKTIHPETNNSLLIHAIQNKKGKAALKLIECGAEVNDRHNFSQDTALILAARNGMKNVCEALLKKGVQVDSENLEDETALLVAMNAKIALLLEITCERRLYRHHSGLAVQNGGAWFQPMLP